MSDSEDSTDESTEPAAKRLRCSDPDLTVAVKFTGEDGEEAEKEYPMYAAVLARLSKFIDATLSAPMREKETNRIILQDVSPSVFEAALKFEEDTMAARNMTVEDVVQVVEFYDKYEFAAGFRLCDHVLLEYFREHNNRDLNTPPDNLDLLVDAVVLSERCNLKKALAKGRLYINMKLATDEVPYGATMFSLEHVKKLQPLFVRGILQKEIVVTQEEMESCLFPRLLVESLKLRVYKPDVVIISLRGSHCKADGQFHWDAENAYDIYGDRVVKWAGRRKGIFVERSELCSKDWAIVAKRWFPDLEGGPNEPDLVLWKCPSSRNLDFPPTGPWIPVDKRARGNPTIIYDSVSNDCLS